MNRINEVIIALLMTLLLGTGCSPDTQKSEWEEEKEFLEEAIRWYWNDTLVVLESIHSDSGNYLANIKPVMKSLRESNYFSDDFCNNLERKYELCDEHYRHYDDFDRHECLDADPITNWTYHRLDSVVIRKGRITNKGREVVADIFASEDINGESHISRGGEITFFLIRVNDKLRIDSSSAMEGLF